MTRERKFGLAVLAYTLLTQFRAYYLAIAGIEAAYGVAWLLYLFGSFGYIFRARWARWVILVGSVASLALVARELIQVFTTGAGDPIMRALEVGLLWGLPHLVIFALAMHIKVERSTKAVAWARGPRSTWHDIAYGSFLFLGLMSLYTWIILVFVAGPSGGGDTVAAAIGFLVAVPFGIPILLAMLMGPGLSLVLWRDYRLGTLTVLTLIFLILVGILESWGILLIVYGAACLTVGVLWFAKYRKAQG